MDIGISPAKSARERPAPIQVELGLRESTREAEGHPDSYQGGAFKRLASRPASGTYPLWSLNSQLRRYSWGTEHGHGQWSQGPGLDFASFVPLPHNSACP